MILQVKTDATPALLRLGLAGGLSAQGFVGVVFSVFVQLADRVCGFKTFAGFSVGFMREVRRQALRGDRCIHVYSLLAEPSAYWVSCIKSRCEPEMKV